MKLKQALLAATVALSFSVVADAQGLRPHNDNFCSVIGRLDPDAPLVTRTEAPLTFKLTFNSNVTPAQRAVCLQALGEWSARIETAGALDNPYPLTFKNGPLPAPKLAQAATTWDSAGYLTGSTITIDNDGSSQFFIDPTPGDDSEFDASGACIRSTCTQSDLLTVMRHELGHSFGWDGFFQSGGAAPNPFPGFLMSGTIFDPARLNVAADPALTPHVDSNVFPGDLMSPGLSSGTRIAISDYPDLSVVARAYIYGVKLRFIDSNGVFPYSGSTESPFGTFFLANALAPEGMTLVVIPGTYDELNPAVFDKAHRIVLARGGSVVLD